MVAIIFLTGFFIGYIFSFKVWDCTSWLNLDKIKDFFKKGVDF